MGLAVGRIDRAVRAAESESDEIMWVVLAAVVIVATGGAYWGWRVYSLDPLAGIQTAQVMKGDIEISVLATGTLRPVKLVAVGAQVSGRLTSMKVAVGQAVKKDDLIAEIDNLAQVNAVKTAAAFLNSVGAQLNEKQATLVYAKAAMSREEITLAQKASQLAGLSPGDLFDRCERPAIICALSGQAF